MLSLGVDITLSGQFAPPPPAKDVALMGPEEAVEVLKGRGVAHNIALMARLTDQRSFAAFLEQARGETSWKRLRARLDVEDTEEEQN